MAHGAINDYVNSSCIRMLSFPLTATRQRAHVLSGRPQFLQKHHPLPHRILGQYISLTSTRSHLTDLFL